MSKTLPLVKVEWVDSATCIPWTHTGDVSGISHCTSVGYVLHKNKTEICLAPSIDEDNSNVLSALSIPRKAITRIIKLNEKQ